MALPAIMVPGAYSAQAAFDTSILGNTVGIPAAREFYTLLPIAQLTGSGAALTLEGCTDPLGTSWGVVSSATGVISGPSTGVVTLDDRYKVPSANYTYFRWRVSQVGTKSIAVFNGGGITPQDVNIVGGGTGGTVPAGIALDGVDDNTVTIPQNSTARGIRGWLSLIFGGIGTPSDAAWSGSGAGTLVAIGKAIVGKLAGVLTVTINGMLPAGTNILGSLISSGTETPFVPIPGATTGLTVGTTATTAPVVLPTVTASTYRIRNAASSASAVAWRLGTTSTGNTAVAPVANGTNGTGGTVGDKSIDPGGVEIFALTAAQQTAIAAGSLYLSAVTSAGGSATIYITPGVAGA